MTKRFTGVLTLSDERNRARFLLISTETLTLISTETLMPRVSYVSEPKAEASRWSRA
jgi:hypothetical protein